MLLSSTSPPLSTMARRLFCESCKSIGPARCPPTQQYLTCKCTGKEGKETEKEMDCLVVRPAAARLE